FPARIGLFSEDIFVIALRPVSTRNGLNAVASNSSAIHFISEGGSVMPKQVTQIDKVLTAALGKTKKTSHFLFTPGTKDHGLVISKEPLKSNQIIKARARSGGNKLIRGTCEKVKGILTFSFHGEAIPSELKKKS